MPPRDLKHDILTRLDVMAKSPAMAMAFGGSDALAADLDEFLDAAGRHEYSTRDIADINIAMAKVLGEKVPEDISVRIHNLLHSRRGPSHLIALEELWRGIRMNYAVQVNAERIGMGAVGALSRATVEAMRAAVAYCWAPTPVEAVAAAAEGLPDDVAPSPFALGDLGGPGAAGWWWFEDPIPVQTLVNKGIPVNALLWRREYPPSETARTFFTCFVWDKKLDMYTPSTSWLWPDGVTLKQLPSLMTERYTQIQALNRAGVEASGVDVTVSAAVWFSRFFMEASTWLRQRILASARGGGIRQPSRRIQREHKLPVMPTVEIIQLRRKEVTVTRNLDAAAARDWSCRWIVHGFTRNQWYPSKGVHAPLYIDSYIKGPDDKPLKTSVRIYSVER